MVTLKEVQEKRMLHGGGFGRDRGLPAVGTWIWLVRRIFGDMLRQQIEQIVSLTDEEFDFVMAHFQHRRFKKRQIVIHEEDPVLYEYFVISGLMKVSRVDGDGKEHIVQFAMEDWWVTDIQAFHRRAKATLMVDCLEDTEAFAISLENKEKLCRELQKMERFFLFKTTEDYIALQKRILCFLSASAGDRYHSLITVYPGLLQRVPKSMIASYLGVTRETLSRLGSHV
ncbi:MAG TPA: Crp/Fnr family transcriptional regulator [Puia sp.]|nr:Crp/Fnr family transcriptional regulator [Puia sp.]